jgi:hypothetical protein
MGQRHRRDHRVERPAGAVGGLDARRAEAVDQDALHRLARVQPHSAAAQARLQCSHQALRAAVEETEALLVERSPARARHAVHPVPHPCRRDLVVEAIELDTQKRVPGGHVGLVAQCRFEPALGGNGVERLPALDQRAPQCQKAVAQPCGQRDAVEAQKVTRGAERVEPAAIEKPHPGGPPAQGRGETQLVQFAEVSGVCGAEEVVVALDLDIAEFERAGETAQLPRGLEQSDVKASLAEVVCQRQPGGPSADDSYRLCHEFSSGLLSSGRTILRRHSINQRPASCGVGDDSWIRRTMLG